MGRRGAIEFPEIVLWTQAGDAQHWNQPIQAQRIHAPTIDPYVAQLDHFRDVIRGTAPSLQPVEDGARSLMATLAIAEAAATGRRVDLRDRYAALRRATCRKPSSRTRGTTAPKSSLAKFCRSIKGGGQIRQRDGQGMASRANMCPCPLGDILEQI